MAATQDALVCKVEEPTKLVVAQHAKLAAQPKGIKNQFVKMAEKSAKVAELQGARQYFRTGKMREGESGRTS